MNKIRKDGPLFQLLLSPSLEGQKTWEPSWILQLRGRKGAWSGGGEWTHAGDGPHGSPGSLMQSKWLVIDNQLPARSTTELNPEEQKPRERLEGTRADNYHFFNGKRAFFSLGCHLKLHERATRKSKQLYIGSNTLGKKRQKNQTITKWNNSKWCLDPNWDLKLYDRSKESRYLKPLPKVLT